MIGPVDLFTKEEDAELGRAHLAEDLEVCRYLAGTGNYPQNDLRKMVEELKMPLLRRYFQELGHGTIEVVVVIGNKRIALRGL